MKLPKSHPFVQLILKAENLEQVAGTITDEVLELRQKAQKEYPELFKTYLEVKNSRQVKEKNLELSKKDEEKRKRKIKNWSVMKSLFTKPGSGRGD